MFCPYRGRHRESLLRFRGRQNSVSRALLLLFFSPALVSLATVLFRADAITPGNRYNVVLFARSVPSLQ